ncbi:protein of unknown function [Fodinibius roseus]|uniref:IrrE N-terminal-like domain-containing protein n=1 Tax=Fodinibius roseus TaxID=1194090 RepID=A0A1M5JJ10_9BACT|nr:ImmA/IrrE family metallo-endopeptidase [Fodinibius roseus]SHG40498.1 protein of unknown function [Fodinibius roseus]
MSNRAARVANQIRKEFFIHGRIDLGEIEDLCAVRNAFVKYEQIDGAQGRILFSGASDKSMITVDDCIDYLPKEKFVLAHEFGHHLLHKQLMNFVCQEYDFNKWNKNSSRTDYREYEANNFAAELLMPKYLVRDITSGKGLSVSLMEDLSDELGSSITSAYIQYTKYGDIPCYVVFSENGLIEWVTKTDDFYLGFLDEEDLPINSTPKVFFDNGKKKKKEVCDAIDWFPKLGDEGLLLNEESIYLDSYSSVITLLWICEDYG